MNFFIVVSIETFSYKMCISGIFKQTASVTYTHLRAHETVLDVVCRLLLEKKIELSQAIEDQYRIHSCELTTPY